MRRSTVHVSAFISLLFASAAHARLARPEDLASVNENEIAEVLVDAHGHSRAFVERTIRINNDEGRDRESVQVVDYNSRASHVKVLIAETINGDKKTAVAKSNIESKAVGDFARSFDVQMRLKMTFPDVKVGSHIHFKYVIDTDEVPNEGFFSWLADFNWWYTEHYKATIRSVMPLHFWKNDPRDLLNIQPGRDGKYFTINVETRGPIALQTTQEENPFIRSERSETFGVSTLEDWSKYAGPTITAQEKLLSAPLPAGLAKIRDEAAGEKDSVKKLDRVMAAIAEQFRYFGDWRRRKGGFVPRPLDEIDSTRYGDCKDLSAVATAIFRSMGLKADMVWTLRGEEHLKPARIWFSLPVDWFNHAITRVEVDSKVYWLDATNPVTYARAVPVDVSSKPAFVLRADHPFLEFTPEIDPKQFETERTFTYDLQPNGTTKVSGDIQLKSRSAIPMTINSFYKPVATSDYELIRALSYGYKVLDSWVGEYSRHSRIVQDLNIPFKITLDHVGVRTSAGYGFILSREGLVDRLLEDTRERASDLALGEAPGQWKTVENVVGAKRVGSEDLDCELESQWVKLTRHVTKTANGIRSSDHVEVLKSVIPQEELGSKEFAAFQSKVRECFFREVAVLQSK